MPKFLLHRIQRMTANPAAEKITPGLEAAAYLHWITCYEHAPEKLPQIGENLPELRKNVADYLALVAQETEAHLELMAALQQGAGGVAGTKDFEAAAVPARPGRVEMVKAQVGWNWVLLYWEPPAEGGPPWCYRVYRTDKRSAPVLVGTVVEPEALLPDQPEGVKFYYYVTTYNAAGESEASADFGLMFNAPDEVETAGATPVVGTGQRWAAHIPEHELPIRRELGEAMMNFMQKLAATRLGHDEEDAVMRQVATEEYRQAVEKAARLKIEVSLAWHSLGVWTEDGKERIGYFARALESRRAETAADVPKTPQQKWAALHMEADCLFEIGRVHFQEGSPEAARRFLSEALPLARQSDALQAAAGAVDDGLEGRIAGLLLQIPDEE